MRNLRLYRWMQKHGYDDYDHFYHKSIEDIEWFWEEAIKEIGIEWFQPYSQPLDLSLGVQWPKWFVDGKINVTHNALDKWIFRNDTKKKPAIIYENESETVTTITYEDLEREVSRFARGLRSLGLQKGDTVVLFMPMVPETVVAMLAISRIGAIFTPVFSGYAPDAISKRVEAAQAKCVITADGFTRRQKKIRMKPTLDQALQDNESVQHVLVVSNIKEEVPMHEGRDLLWENVLQDGDPVPCEQMQSDDPFMLIYTSGTTSRPKGIIHTHSGFPVKAAFDAGMTMDVCQEDKMLWVTDMGWMMGPFLVYGTLLNGATMVLLDGSPDYPDPGRLWRLVEKHQLTHIGISPTLIRALMPQGEKWYRDCDLSSLKLFGSTGEPWNPEPWLWLFNEVGKKNIPIYNYSGGTEISGGIFGNVLLKPIVPTAFNVALPGMHADILNPEGESVLGLPEEVGELVLKKPWVGMAHGFWQEPERYERTYWSRWPDTWVHGDWVKQDGEGHWYITGRSDDTLNIAGKRMGPAEMESILVQHDSVKEAGTIGVPDEIKGEVAVCFVVLTSEDQVAPEKDELRQELKTLVGEKLGKALRPKDVHFVSDLPKTRNAKVMRRVIRAAYLGEDLGDTSALENPDVLDEINRVQSVNK
nr:AMP-binding protein [Caldalkalibacillus salinus]